MGDALCVLPLFVGRGGTCDRSDQRCGNLWSVPVVRIRIFKGLDVKNRKEGLGLANLDETSTAFFGPF